MLGYASIILFALQLVAYLVNHHSERGGQLWLSRVYVTVLALSAAALASCLVFAPATVPTVHAVVLLVRVLVHSYMEMLTNIGDYSAIHA